MTAPEEAVRLAANAGGWAADWPGFAVRPGGFPEFHWRGTGSGVLLAYVWKNLADESTFEPESALGPGTTVSSITLALDIPNRNDPRNILNRLSSISKTANTISKEGLQDLLSSVALELLRQEKSITSAFTRTSHHKFVGQAEREFQSLSVHGRSKVDRLTGTCELCWLSCFSLLILYY